MLVDANQPHTGVTGAIRQASRLTGTNFQYLLAAAKVESGLDPSANARSSSAGGLFQFIDQTWLGTLKQSGTSLGYGRYADAIEQTKSGRYVVSDPSLRNEIMKLRRDPTANAVMAGAFTQSNANYLTQKLGRAPTDSELYIAHFLGAGGAARLIGLSAATPNALASDTFPQAARANRSIFFNAQGRPRSFSQVTQALAARYDVAAASVPAEPAAETASAVPASATAVARVARIYEAAAPVAPASRPVAGEGPSAFLNLYSADADAGAQDTRPAAAPSRPQPERVATADEPLGLFQDMRPNVRALFTGS